MSASYPTKLLLAFRNGNHCAFPNCPRELTVDSPTGSNSVVTGQAAHIAGENSTAARYDKSMDDKARNHYNNLVYMCGDHHTQIDKQESDFSVATLLRIKAEHEGKVRKAMTDAFAQIGFPELRIATEWANNYQPRQDAPDYSLSPPDQKIRKNKLSNGSRLTITMGLSIAKLVGEFVQTEAQIDEDFPERLKTGFLQEYFRLREQGFQGDDLFDLMCEFSQRGLNGQSRKSAGLAVLIYLFEKCDIFEK